MLDELVYVRFKSGWIVKDKNGNQATGLTKDMARNQYFALYQKKGSDNSTNDLLRQCSNNTIFKI